MLHSGKSIMAESMLVHGFMVYQSLLRVNAKRSKKKARSPTLVAMQLQSLLVLHQRFLLLIPQISSSLQPQARLELAEARKSI
jgi:hypothetical protein